MPAFSCHSVFIKEGYESYKTGQMGWVIVLRSSAKGEIALASHILLSFVPNTPNGEGRATLRIHEKEG